MTGAQHQQYCLKWNNHQNNMLRVFTRLLNHQYFTDVILAAEGKNIKCHKMVLSACSSYFEQLFVNFSEPNQIVILKDTSFLDIAAIVDFMYKGEINVSQDRLSSLLKTAENLKVKGLAEVSGEEKEASPPTSASSTSAMSRLSSGPPPMTMMGRPGHGVSPGPAGQQENNNMGGFMNINGELKKKRGRPRTLDGPEDDDNSNVFSPRISLIQGGVNGLHSSSGTQSPILTQSLTSSNSNSVKSAVAHAVTMSPLQAALTKPLSADNSKDNSNSSPPTSKPATPCPTSPSTQIKLEQVDMGRNCDTPGSGSLNGTFVPTISPDTVASWGIIKMNDYLVSGTRQQYWEEYFVKNVMGAVKNKEIDMKGAAELLGVSYGTLYGRYRESFGYLKHAWNVSGRPQKKTNLWTDPNTKQILESMRSGAINIKQAAEALGMEPAMLAYQLAGRAPGDKSNGNDDIAEEDDEEDYDENLMEVQPDIIMNDGDDHDEHFDSIVEEEGVDPIQGHS